MGYLVTTEWRSTKKQSLKIETLHYKRLWEANAVIPFVKREAKKRKVRGSVTLSKVLKTALIL